MEYIKSFKKKEKEDATENVEPIVTAPEEDEKLQAEDDFWLFTGSKGAISNTKVSFQKT